VRYIAVKQYEKRHYGQSTKVFRAFANTVYQPYSSATLLC